MPPRNGTSAGAGGSAPQPLPSSPRAAARRQSTKGGREEDGSDYEEEEEVEVEEDEAAGEAAEAPEKTATDAQGPEPPQQKRFKFPGKLGCEADVALLLQVRVARSGELQSGSKPHGRRRPRGRSCGGARQSWRPGASGAAAI